MLVFIIRRLMQAVVVMVVMSALVFGGIYLVGNPVTMLISDQASEAERLAVIRDLGLDQPVWQQYLTFVGKAVVGEFGKSFRAGEPAMRLIFQHMPATIELALVAMLLAVLIGAPLGV